MAFGRSGVLAGTYRSVQVDKYGRVVAATNPTTVAGYGLTDVYTKSETYNRTEISKAIGDAVTLAVNGLVDSAPGALDTLKELADAIGNDPSFATTMVNELAKKAPLASPKFTGAPEVPTPAASSKGLQAANMAALATAVAASARQFKAAVIGVSGNLTLTAAQMGNAVQFNSGPVTLALPALADVGNGASVMLRNPSTTATQTIVVAASGSIVDAGSTVGSMALKPLEWVELASSGTVWFVVGRGKLKEVAEIDSPSFTGNPTVPTAPVGSTSAQIANMAAVMAALQTFGLGATTGPKILDFDGVTESGLYRAEGSAKNTPFPNAPAVLLNVQYNTGGAFQLAGSCSVTVINSKLFWRTQASGVWSDWQQVARLDSPAFTGTPMAPTAAVGTNTDQLATMAALLRAVNAFKRSYSGNVVGIGADITLTASQTGYAFNATAAVTITLPSSSEAGSGGTFVIRNVSSGVVTVATTSGKIFERNNTVSTAPIQPGEWIELQASTSNYFINKRGTLSEISQVVSDGLAAFGIGKQALNGNGLNFNEVPLNSFVRAEGTEASSAALNWPLMGVPDTTAVAFNLITTGSPGAARVTQIATQVFPAAGNRGRMFFRVRHDSSWFPWQEISTTAFVQRAVDGLASINSPSFTGSPTAPTQKVNDASKSLATTEFVELSKRNFSGPVLGFSSNMTLSAAQSGRLYQANANNLTVTLPAAADAPGGTAYAFRNPSGGTLSITAASGNIVAGVTLGTLVLQSGEYVELVSNTSTSWFVSTRGKLAETPTVDAMNAAVAAAAPPGQIAHFALSAPPPGWLKRNGAAVSRTTYAVLFAAIGTQFGAGDGSTTFNLPDDRELFDRAWTDGANVYDTGRALFSTQVSQNLLHNHNVTIGAAGSHYHTTTFPRERISAGMVETGGNAVLGDYVGDGIQSHDTTTAPNHTHTASVSNNGGLDARPGNRAYLACIKY
ncbi:tail fiber protein [Pseudomonas sp. NBRC 111131]